MKGLCEKLAGGEGIRVLERAYTLVTGPAGGGKTMLIERLVASNRSRWLGAVRVLEDGAVGEAVEDKAGNDETRRWEAAGPVETHLLRVPLGWRGDCFDALAACYPGLLAAEVVLVEGNVRFRARELEAAVFVARPGEPLVVEEEREVGRLSGPEALRLMLGLPPVDEDEVLPYGLNPGDVVEESEEAFDGEVLFELPDEVGQAILRLLEEGRPLVRRKRWVRRGWEALADVDLAVIPTSGPGGREAAERLAAEIAGVRQDDELRREVESLYGWPRSWHAADLRDPRDAGTVKVVQAVKRRWRSAFDRREPSG